MIRVLISRATLAVSAFALVACHPGSLLDAPVPAGVVDPSSLGTLEGAEALRAGAIADFANAVTGADQMIQEGGELGDEFEDGYPGVEQQAVNSRQINPAANQTDLTYGRLQKTRAEAEAAARHLRPFIKQGIGADLSEAWSIVGYSQLLLAEHMCTAIPLSEIADDGTVTFGPGQPTDSVLRLALVSFDSAGADAQGNASSLMLAAVGRGRALLDLGQYGAAATAVAPVSAGFEYDLQSPVAQVNLYSNDALGGTYLSVADRKGVNGLDFVSAHDPRMPIDSLGLTFLGAPLYYPLKFPLNTAANDPIPLATAAEASLIRAEALLPLNGGVGSAWLDTLQALRTTLGDTETIVDPGTPAAQVDLLMRERAFTMFGTGHRLGDLRRLIRLYSRPANTVFPTGPFVNGSQTFFTTFGNDVSFPIQASEIGNPLFHGCSNTTS